jgi:phosphomannomutase
MQQDTISSEYRCPGESYTISRSVHLGRLASFHPACRECPRREDTAGLSARQTRQLAEVAARVQPQLFHAEGVGCPAINDLDPRLARKIAVEFALRLVNLPRDGGGQTIVTVADDGRLATAAIRAAIIDGLRWTGCAVIDLGPASAPCCARAIEQLLANGAVFVGSTGGAPRSIALKFWAQVEPLSHGNLLDDIAAAVEDSSCQVSIDRPTRRYGPLGRYDATEGYLSDFLPAYHALRPLRFVLDCLVEPIFGYLEELMKNVACRVVRAETAWEEIGQLVVRSKAHFGVRIDDDGDNCRVFDERGRAVGARELLALLAQDFPGLAVTDGALRQQTFRKMRRSGAIFASDSAGRIWYAGRHAPLPDALQTVTLLLVLLSRGDLALSAVLGQAVLGQADVTH